MATGERWRRLANWPRYDVSSLGRVLNTSTGKYLTPVNTGCRMTVMLPNRTGTGTDRHQCVRIHRLVLLTFRGEPPHGRPFGTHRDGDFTNNRLSNLRWASQKTNYADARRHGTYTHGERAGKSHLTNRDILKIRRQYRAGLVTYRDLAEHFGVSENAIGHIIRRQTWTHI